MSARSVVVLFACCSTLVAANRDIHKSGTQSMHVSRDGHFQLSTDTVDISTLPEVVHAKDIIKTLSESHSTPASASSLVHQKTNQSHQSHVAATTTTVGGSSTTTTLTVPGERFTQKPAKWSARAWLVYEKAMAFLKPLRGGAS